MSGGIYKRYNARKSEMKKRADEGEHVLDKSPERTSIVERSSIVEKRGNGGQKENYTQHYSIPQREKYIQHSPVQYSQKEARNKSTGRIITGLKSVGRGTLREASGFAKEIRTEGLRSGFKTERTLQRTGRQLRRAATRQPRTRIRQFRPATPPSASLGEMAVSEASQNWVPHLQRQYFSDGNEQRDLLGQGNRDMASLIETPETIIKKREQRYY